MKVPNDPLCQGDQICPKTKHYSLKRVEPLWTDQRPSGNQRPLNFLKVSKI